MYRTVHAVKAACIRVAQLVRACVRNAQVRVLPRVSEHNMRQLTHKTYKTNL